MTQGNATVSKAPGKVIVTGEHAVVYGMPAIAMPINLLTSCRVFQHSQPGIRIDLTDLGQVQTFSVDVINDVQLVGQAGFDLPLYLLSLIGQDTGQSFDGVGIAVSSDIPIGIGLGSSAAVIAAMIRAINDHFSLKMTSDRMFEIGHRAENLIHGKSSGLDVAVSLYNQMVWYKDGQITPLSHSRANFCIIHTGMPENTTKECVNHVAENTNPGQRWDEFESVADKMLDAISSGNQDGIKQAIRRNHQLLCQIGVVPEKIQSFISQIEAAGGAAKISGAGSINGGHGGIVIAFDIHQSDLKAILLRHNHKLITD
jgi:mevalonate kinase